MKELESESWFVRKKAEGMGWEEAWDGFMSTLKKGKETKERKEEKLENEKLLEAQSQNHKAVDDELAEEQKVKIQPIMITASEFEAEYDLFMEMLEKEESSGEEKLQEGQSQNHKAVSLNDSTTSDSPDSDVQSGGGDEKRVAKKRVYKKRIKNVAYRKWINTWHIGTGKELIPKHLTSDFITYNVYTDAYFRKEGGGIGVIIRDIRGNPIVASAVPVAYTEILIPFRYHQLLSVTKGIELAVKYSIPHIQLFCNSKHVARLVSDAIRTRCGCSDSPAAGNSYDEICLACVRCIAREDYDLVLPLLKTIAEKVPKFTYPLRITKCKKKHNNVADYLARNAAPGMEVLWPSKFPYGLKKILCKEYFEYQPYGQPRV